MSRLPGLAIVLVLIATGASAQLVFSDGSVQTRAASPHANVIYVSASGSAADNGARLNAAIAAIGDAAATNPYVIQLDPGEYRAVDTNFQLKSFVTVQGAGTWSTTLSSTAITVVAGADSAILRDLSILSSEASGVGFLQFGNDGASIVTVLLERVRILINNDSGTSIGVQVSNGCTVTLVNCEVAGTPLTTFLARTGIFVQGGATERSQCELLESRIDLAATGSSSIQGIGLQAGGDAIISGSTVSAMGGSTHSTVFVGAGATFVVRQSEIASTDEAVFNSGVYDAFSTRHLGTLPAEDLPSGGGDTAYTRYNQCAQDGVEL